MLGQYSSGTLPGAPYNVIQKRVVRRSSARETDCANQELFLLANGSPQSAREVLWLLLIQEGIVRTYVDIANP